MKDEKNEKDEIVIQAIPTASLQDAESSQEFLAAEHALTFWPALRQHWPTVAWALFMNLVRRSLARADLLQHRSIPDTD